MGFKGAWFLCLTLFLFSVFSLISSLHARSPGQIKAMEERAETVTKRKSRFVAKVLDQHNILYRVNKSGIVTHVNATGEWVAVRRLDILPMVRYGGDVDEVVGHEIFIYTDGETVRLLSYLKVR